MSREFKILGILTILVLIGVGALFLFIPSSNTKTTSQATLVRSDSPTRGNGSVEVVEFADFQCPACAEAAPALEQIARDYKNVKLVFRIFPLPQHANAKPAARAAWAAKDQGKFWEMYDALYANQDKWAESSSANDYFISLAQSLGLDVNKFKADLSSNKFDQTINRDLQDGQALGVDATPTVYVNGNKLSGFPDYPTLKSAVSGK
jgi:protein-disulfide isomerase